MTERTAIPAMRSVLDAGVAMMNDRTLVSRRSMEVATALVTAAVGAAVMWGAAEHDIGWGDAEAAPFVTTSQMRSVLAFGLPVVGFVTASVFLGLYVGTILYLVFVMIFQGGYRPLFSLALAFGVALAMRLIFPIWFKVPLLTGPLEALLGLY